MFEHFVSQYISIQSVSPTFARFPIEIFLINLVTDLNTLISSLAADFGLSENVQMDRKGFVMRAGMVIDQWRK